MKFELKCEYFQTRKMAVGFIGAFLYLMKLPWKWYLRMLCLEREIGKMKEKVLSSTFKRFLFSLIMLFYNEAVEANYLIV